MTEQWRPIPGFEGSYEVSDLGRVRSVDRWVYRLDGGKSLRKGKLMKSHQLSNAGHMTIKLKVEGAVTSIGVHALVAMAFIGPRPEGLDVCHNNGIPDDNRPENLRYDSRSANIMDAVRHGTHSMSRKTHCKSGHAFDESNTIRRSDGGRDCAACRKGRRNASRARQRLLVAGTAVAVSTVLAGCGGPSEAATQSSAYNTCKHYVADQLKAPSTADFSGVLSSTMTATSTGYEVSGTVDAQNGFGAQIRSNWTCELSGEVDHWTLVNLDVS